MADLCRELREQSDSETPLSQRFERVRVSAEAIWNLQRLPWFTDHRAQRHSKRLVELAGQSVDALQTTDQRLRRAEIFVLLSACYLHDIGMQDMVIEDRFWDELGPEDYETIRQRHPERGRELIVQRSLSHKRGQMTVDLDDRPDYLEPIALVSQGHGSQFFRATTEVLDTRVWAPDGHPVRASLLTALLLMADELDIGSERALFPAEASLSPVASLHHFLNHYVVHTEVVPGATSKRRRVKMVFDFPPDSEAYRPDVRRVIVDKICAQARLVNPIVERDTDGELIWETEVDVSEQTDIGGARKQMAEPALLELRRQTRNEDLVGRDDLIQSVLTMFDEDSLDVVSLVALNGSDLDALAAWFRAEAAARGHIPFELSFIPSVGRDSGAILAEIGELLHPNPSASPNIADLAQALADAEAPIAFFFRECQAAETEALGSVERLATAVRAGGGHGMVVMAHDGSVSTEADSELELSPVRLAELRTHLVSRLGYSEEEAGKVAHEDLAASEGQAGALVALLAVRRLRNQRRG